MTGPSPAFFALARDPAIHRRPRALLVYHEMLAALDFREPRMVKAWWVAEVLSLKPHTAGAAIALLIARGYLTEHPSDDHRVRRLTLAWSLPDSAVARQGCADVASPTRAS